MSYISKKLNKITKTIAWINEQRGAGNGYKGGKHWTNDLLYLEKVLANLQKQERLTNDEEILTDDLEYLLGRVADAADDLDEVKNLLRFNLGRVRELT